MPVVYPGFRGLPHAPGTGWLLVHAKDPAWHPQGRMSCGQSLSCTCEWVLTQGHPRAGDFISEIVL